MKKNLFILLLFTLTLCTMNAQDLNGKWILKDMESNGEKHYPWHQHLVIDGDKIDFYMDYHGTKRHHELTRTKDLFLNKNKSPNARYELINKDNLFLFTEGTSNDTPTIFAWHYVKLIPTNTSLTQAQFENFKYKVFIPFEAKNMRSEDHIFTPENSRFEKEGDSYYLRIVNYLGLGIRFPIKEITEEYIIFYGIPFSAEEYVKGLRVE